MYELQKQIQELILNGGGQILLNDRVIDCPNGSQGAGTMTQKKTYASILATGIIENMQK